MATIARRAPRGMLPDLLDWVDPPWTMFPFPAGPGFRIEDYVEDGRYTVRAELPGLDPAKDIHVTVEGDILTIRAERREEEKQAHRSEFRYGSLSRSVRLPVSPDPKEITAHYGKGILEVCVPVPQAKSGTQRIEIKTAG
jgi:HSP20 family protein